MKITKVNGKCIDLIILYEGIKLKPYLCPAKIPTIGVGCTFYPNGKKVSMNDKPITRDYAIEMLREVLKSFEKSVDSFTTDQVNQNQFNALVSFAFNLGANALKNSTLIKKVNFNPNDPKIKNEFMKWTYAGGKQLNGLIKRRKAESDLYFMP